jgi:hypothetical protein
MESLFVREHDFGTDISGVAWLCGQSETNIGKSHSGNGIFASQFSKIMGTRESKIPKKSFCWFHPVLRMPSMSEVGILSSQKMD